MGTSLLWWMFCLRPVLSPAREAHFCRPCPSLSSCPGLHWLQGDCVCPLCILVNSTLPWSLPPNHFPTLRIIWSVGSIGSINRVWNKVFLLWRTGGIEGNKNIGAFSMLKFAVWYAFVWAFGIKQFLFFSVVMV